MLRRYLVVANQTILSDALAQTVSGCIEAGPCRFHVLVPATHPHDHFTWTEGQAIALAQRQLEAGLARFRELGAEVEGQIGDEKAAQAIADVLQDGLEVDEIILSTLPVGPSRWLQQKLPDRIERAHRLPVTHVVAETATA